MATHRDIGKRVWNGVLTGSLAVLTCLISAGFATAECVEVPPGPKPASGNVRISALVDKKPVGGAKITVLLDGTVQPIALLFTDNNGVVSLPPLKPGLYSISASTSDDLHSFLVLRVFLDTRQEISEFAMDFAPAFTPTADVTGPDTKVPVSVQAREFRGVVQDPSGAAVPGATVQVFARDSKENLKVLQVAADQNGFIASPLPDGAYTFVVQFLGFRRWVRGLKIDQNEAEKNLTVTLNVGSCP
jgi:hypothetical protein